RPLYEPAGRKKSVPEFVINCLWFAQKVNSRFCGVLRRLIDASPKPLRLRLFVGSSLARQSDFLPFFRDLRSALPGAELEVVINRPYAEYMALLEEGDIAIDSHHFG